MTTTETLQETTAKYIIPYLFIHIPIVWLISLLTGNDGTWSIALTVVFSLIPFISWKTTGAGPLTRYLTAVSFMLIIATMVYAFRGHEWQIDVHMYFFAGLAMLLAFADWRVYILATTVVALHHLSLNFIIPAWIFPNGSDFFRVVMHAVIVVLETAVLSIGTVKLVSALNDASDAMAQAEASHQEASKAADEKKAAEAKAEEVRHDQMLSLATTFESEVGSIVENVSQASQDIQKLANGMSEDANSLDRNALEASNSTENIARNADAVASASEELSSSVNEISRQVNHAKEISTNAADLGTNTSKDVESLSLRVNEISEVVTLIAGIADQTNLLALNATIESARAGEAGKGFAVVANEVKNLAGQTAQATEQITAQINSVVSATNETVISISKINTAISEVQETSSTIEFSIQEQDSATREIADKAAETAQDVSSTSSSVENVKQDAQNNANSAQQVLDAAQNLQMQADQMDNTLKSFISKMRG